MDAEAPMAETNGPMRRPPLARTALLSTGFIVWPPSSGERMPPLPEGHISLLITGLARGGTSWAASVCHHLGVDLGRKGPRYENQKLAKALMAGEMSEVRRLLAKPTASGRPAGWKLPALNYHLEAVSALLDKPRLIFVCRDPVAVALRKQRTEQTAGDPMRDVQRNVEALLRMADFAKRVRHPCLFISYEKGMATQAEAVTDIAEFLGSPVTQERAEEVVRVVADDQQGYRGLRAEPAPAHA